MTGYAVVIDALRRFGQAAASAGEQAGSVDLAAALAPVAGALPGSRSGPAVTRAAQAWRGQVAGWSRRVTALGTGMAETAESYAASEQAAQRDLAAGFAGWWEPLRW